MLNLTRIVAGLALVVGAFGTQWTHAAGDCASLAGISSCATEHAPGNASSNYQPSSLRGNPVSVISGNKFQAETDFQAYSSPLSFHRFYNSNHAAQNIGFGYGWRTAYSMVLMRDGDDALKLIQADGREIHFVRDNAGSYRTINRMDGLIVHNEGKLNWQIPDGRVVRFKGSLPVSIEWLNGQSLTLVYNDRYLTKVVDQDGLAIVFEYHPGARELPGYDESAAKTAAGHLAAIAFPDDSRITFEYSGQQNLVSVQRFDGTAINYHYESQQGSGYLTHRSKAEHGRQTEEGRWYYGDDLRVNRYENSADRSWIEFEYPPLSDTQGTTLLRTDDGATESYNWTVSPDTLATTIHSYEMRECDNCETHTANYEYSDDNQITRIIRNNSTTTLDYDQMGRLIEKTSTRNDSDTPGNQQVGKEQYGYHQNTYIAIRYERYNNGEIRQQKSETLDERLRVIQREEQNYNENNEKVYSNSTQWLYDNSTDYRFSAIKPKNRPEIRVRQRGFDGRPLTYSTVKAGGGEIEFLGSSNKASDVETVIYGTKPLKDRYYPHPHYNREEVVAILDQSSPNYDREKAIDVLREIAKNNIWGVIYNPYVDHESIIIDNYLNQYISETPNQCSGIRYGECKRLQKAKENASMSECAYSAEKCAVNGWTEVSMKKLGLSDSYLEEGRFRAKLYKKNNGEYVLSFAGTDTESDLIDSTLQAKGFNSPQYKKALRVSAVLRERLKGAKLSFTGHSLGGGLAIAAALAHDAEAVVFNSAGLSDTYMNRNELDPALAHYTIENYHIKGDLLTATQDIPDINKIAGFLLSINLPATIAVEVANMPSSQGKRFELLSAISQEEYDKKTILEKIKYLHSISAVNSSLDSELERNNCDII